MGEAELKALEDAHVWGIATHWEGCETTHPRCAVQVLIAEVRRLQKQLQQMALRAVTSEGEWQELSSWLKANGHEEVLAHLRGG